MGFFKVGDKIKIKEGVCDPDVCDWVIGDMTGIVDDIGDVGIGILLDTEHPDWVIQELEHMGLNYQDCIYLDESEIEHTEKKLTELEQAVKIIDGLISAINVMPCYWAEFVGLDFALEIGKFLARYDESWQEFVDEMEGENALQEK